MNSSGKVRIMSLSRGLGPGERERRSMRRRKLVDRGQEPPVQHRIMRMTRPARTATDQARMAAGLRPLAPRQACEEATPYRQPPGLLLEGHPLGQGRPLTPAPAAPSAAAARVTCAARALLARPTDNGSNQGLPSPSSPRRPLGLPRAAPSCLRLVCCRRAPRQSQAAAPVKPVRQVQRSSQPGPSVRL